MTDDNGTGPNSDFGPHSDFPPAGAVIAAFGGIRPMATRLDVPVSTVQGWKQRDAIPESRFDEIRAAARIDGIDIDTPPAEHGEETAPESASAGASDDRTAATADEPATWPDPAALPAAAPAPAPQKSGGAMAVAVLALLAAAGAGGYVWWTQQHPAAVLEDTRIAALTADIAGLRRDLSALAARDSAATVAPDQLQALAGRVETLAGRLDAVPAARDLEDVRTAVADNRAIAAANAAAMASLRSGIDNTLSDLSGRLVVVENRNVDAAATQAQAIGLAIAAAEIRRTLRSGAPYSAELATLRGLAGGDASLALPLATLAESADAGVPTVAALARRFDASIGDILAADRTRADAPWYRRALDRVSGIVSVRRVGGDAAGNSTDAIVARAETKLADGELAGAVAEVAALQEAAAGVAAPWLADARAVLAADAAVAAINAQALAALSAARGN
jgi:hypothetical protein